MVSKPQRKFVQGDKVFAKVRGYPPWPAKIQGVTDANTKGAKFSVFFYGTQETAMCKYEELYDYEENKKTFGAKAIKRKLFVEGLQELEEELEKDKASAVSTPNKEKKAAVVPKSPAAVVPKAAATVPKAAATTVPKATATAVPKATATAVPKAAATAAPKAAAPKAAATAVPKTTATVVPKAAATVAQAVDEAANKKESAELESMNVDSDTESGALIIDEGEKKKPMKRKSVHVPNTPNTPDAPEPKKKRGRPKDSTPKGEPHLDSQGEEAQEKEVVSRSGRKIKPKRFADYSNSDVDSDKNEHHPGRGRSKKNEEPNENQVTTTSTTTTNVPAKKRVTAEKKANVVEKSFEEGVTLPNMTSEKPGRFLLARTFAGGNVGIKLDLNRPSFFKSEKAQEQWESTNARNAMKLKAQLESGEVFPEQVKELLDFNVHDVTESDKRTPTKDGSSQHSNFKLRWLRVESKLLSLDAEIKSNLGLDRADADKCLEAMDSMLKLQIDPLMLKKHSHIVGTVKRLRRYIGNLSDWKLSEEETVIFKEKADQIRKKAEQICNKFKQFFVIPEGQTFWQTFSDQVEHFKELTKGMSEEKMFSLIEDPAVPEKNADNSNASNLIVEEKNNVDEPETKSDGIDGKDLTPEELEVK